MYENVFIRDRATTHGTANTSLYVTRWQSVKTLWEKWGLSKQRHTKPDKMQING